MKVLSSTVYLLSTCMVTCYAPTSLFTSCRARSTKLFGNTKAPPGMPAPKDISYGEESRKYRRTVYSHDDWRKHRSPDRFFYYIRTIVSSGVYKSLAREVSTTTGIAATLVVYNALTGGIVDFGGVQHEPILSWLPMLTLPLTPFTLSSPSLGLLLVFRTNTSYQRWDEARKNWGMNINHTRDLVRLGNALYDPRGVSAEKRESDLRTLALCTWAFVRSMKRHLSPEDEDEEEFKKELYEKLPETQAAAILSAAHRPNRALQDISLAIENLPMHFMRKNEIHKAVTIFEDNLGSSERLLTSPVPLFYSRHTARFLSFWLLLLPFALYDSFGSSWNHIGMIPATALISVFLFGIEELATQLEEPFTILPMQAFCDKIYNWCTEIVSWKAGDNGMVVKDPRPEHTIAYAGNPQEMLSMPIDELKAPEISELPARTVVINGAPYIDAEESQIESAENNESASFKDTTASVDSIDEVAETMKHTQLPYDFAAETDDTLEDSPGPETIELVGAPIRSAAETVETEMKATEGDLHPPVSTPAVDARGLGSRGLRAVQGWKQEG